MSQNSDVMIEVGATMDRSVGRSFDTVANKATRARKAVAGGLDKDVAQVRRARAEQGRFDRAVGDASRAVGRQGRRLTDTARDAVSYTRSLGQALRKNQAFSRSARAVGRGLDSVANRWTALAGGAAGIGSMGMTLTMDETITRLGIQANKSKEEMAALKNEIFAISQEENIRIDPVQLTSAIDQIVTKTGDLDMARRNMRNIAMTIQAANAQGLDAGSMVADIAYKFNIKDSDAILATLDGLVVQGKEGAFTLQHLSKEGAQAMAAYAAMGRKGKQAAMEMGALLQISMMGSGSGAEAASAFDSTLADITSNFDKFQELGIQVFDPEKLAEGKKVFRSVPEILRDTMKATEGDVTQYSQLFGDEAIRLVKVLGSEYQDLGKLPTLDKLLGISGDGQTIMKDTATAADSAAASFRNLLHVWRDVADDAFSGPLQSLADTLNGMDPEALKTLMQTGAGAGLFLGGAALTKKAWDIGSGVMGFFGRGKKRKRGKNDEATNPLDAAGGTTPVYVVNMPAGGMGGGGRGRRGRGRGANKRSVGRRLLGGAGKLARGVGQRIMPITAVLGAVDIGTTLMNDSLKENEKGKAVSRDVGGLGGALGGAAAGAAIGSVVPVVGTAIGGLIGSIVGGWGGDALGGAIGDWMFDDDPRKVGREIVNNNERREVERESVTREVRSERLELQTSHTEVNNQHLTERDRSVETNNNTEHHLTRDRQTQVERLAVQSTYTELQTQQLTERDRITRELRSSERERSVETNNTERQQLTREVRQSDVAGNGSLGSLTRLVSEINRKMTAKPAPTQVTMHATFHASNSNEQIAQLKEALNNLRDDLKGDGYQVAYEDS
ncbi:putative tape measure protein [Saliniradius amylolyticus]|uniref:Putative tape measure protein n=1 Tax=Saliniradius amylolyticus TaxID=2183582 RepID=A0A2S2E6C6_9ALTE|nr:hypothetical protein [Saliniradius amylolyticus]AWL12800.1 putative tape measure protein [Saliniradius amylolyticus]